MFFRRAHLAGTLRRLNCARMEHGDSDEPPGRSPYVARAALDSVVLQQFADLLARRPPKRGADVNRAMSDGRTPMWFASSYCHADVVRVINDWAAGLD